jgi:hypothetical protein
MIFVFGSNLLGHHERGAAKDALEQYGAVYGQGIGLYGNSYALPTKKTKWVKMPLSEVKYHIDVFKTFAEKHPELEFNVTRVGCGLAGFTEAQIAPLFIGATKNCHLPEGWKHE